MARFEHTGHAVLIWHCAVSGPWEQVVRAVKVGDPEKFAENPASVLVQLCEPRKRRWRGCRVYPDGLKYLTVEIDGREVYDSRADVPCDMEKWNATAARFSGRTARVRREEK
jgi:hypothetical protein